VLAVMVSSIALVAPTSAASAATRRTPAVGFRPLLAHVLPAAATTTTAPVDLAAARATVASCDISAVLALPEIPATTQLATKSDGCVVLPDRSGGSNTVRYYLGPAVDVPVADAKAEFQSGQGWTVKIDFTKVGAKAWDDLAKAQFHQQVAITYQGVVVAAPLIQPNDQEFASFDGTAVVSGAFTQKEARALAAAARLTKGQ
jgi:preprotein translocase subunit SecD